MEKIMNEKMSKRKIQITELQKQELITMSMKIELDTKKKQQLIPKGQSTWKKKSKGADYLQLQITRDVYGLWNKKGRDKR